MFAYTCTLVERAKAELALLKADRKGVTALEYGVIAAAIIVAISATVYGLGTSLNTMFANVATNLAAPAA
jgi:pilus assembly protein Flp/PilA